MHLTGKFLQEMQLHWIQTLVSVICENNEVLQTLARDSCKRRLASSQEWRVRQDAKVRAQRVAAVRRPPAVFQAPELASASSPQAGGVSDTTDSDTLPKRSGLASPPDLEAQSSPHRSWGAALTALDGATDSDAEEGAADSASDDVDEASSGEWQPPPGSRFDNEEGSAGQPWEEQPLDWRGAVISPPPELHSPSESLQVLLKALEERSGRRCP